MKREEKGTGSVRECTVGHKSHDPCIHVFLMEARVMTFVAHGTWECSVPLSTRLIVTE